MRRSDDILFYCADMTKVTVSVLSNEAVMFQNKPLVMKPGVFKLLDCSDRLVAWARSWSIDVSESPRTIVTPRPRDTSCSASLFTARNESQDTRCHSSDSHDANSDEDVDRFEIGHSLDDFLIVQTKEKDVSKYPWLLRVKHKSCTPPKFGYLCSTCIAAKESGVWSTRPCFSERAQRKLRHARSQPHLLHAAALIGSEIFLSVRNIQYSKALATLKQQFLIAEYIAMNKLPLELYPSMISLNTALGTFGSEAVSVYESADVGREMIQCIAHAVRHEHHQRWMEADVIGVTIDETTDRSVTSQMIVCYKYFYCGKVYEECADLQALPNGKSATIAAALLHALVRDGIPLSKLVFFGTDGASSMVGQRKGVHKRLSQLIPELIRYHCALHRCSLACKHTCASIPKMQYWFDNLEAVARHYCFSATRRFSLHEHQREHGLKVIELVEACVTRWLTHDILSQGVHSSLPAIITQLADDVASDRADIQAIGFLEFFFAEETLYYLLVVRDVVPVLSHFSRIMQGVQVDYVDLQRQLHLAKTRLQVFITTPGENVLRFDAFRASIQQLLPEKRMRATAWHVLETTRLLIANMDSYFPSLPIQDAFENLLSRSIFLGPLENEIVPIGAFDTLLQHYSFSHLRNVTQFNLNMAWSNFANFCKVHDGETKIIEQEGKKVRVPLTTHDMLLLFLSVPRIQIQCASICKVIRIYLCFTVTTASCERGFSVVKLVKSPLRASLSNAFLEILVVLAHCKVKASDECINLAMNIFINMKERRYLSQLSSPDSLAVTQLCSDISAFVWGQTITAHHVAEEEQRFSLAAGLNIDNERFSGGAFCGISVYSRAKEQMAINAAAWGKVPARHADVAMASLVAEQPALKPAAKRQKPSNIASVAVPAPLPKDVYAVEQIVNIKVIGHHLMYLVKWVGFESCDNSWEPEDNILDPALVANFQATHPSAYQAATAAIAKRKQGKDAASAASMMPDPSIDQSPAEIQQQSDRSNRLGRQVNPPSRFQE